MLETLKPSYFLSASSTLINPIFLFFILQGSRFSQAAAALHEFKYLCVESGEQDSSLYWLGRVRSLYYILPPVINTFKNPMLESPNIQVFYFKSWK